MNSVLFPWNSPKIYYNATGCWVQLIDNKLKNRLWYSNPALVSITCDLRCDSRVGNSNIEFFIFMIQITTRDFGSVPLLAVLSPYTISNKVALFNQWRTGCTSPVFRGYGGEYTLTKYITPIL